MYEDLANSSVVGETKAAVANLLKTLEHLPRASRGTAMLNVAAELIEGAAYDLAGLETAPRVARLILMSAEVARVASIVREEPVDTSEGLRRAG